MTAFELEQSQLWRSDKVYGEFGQQCASGSRRLYQRLSQAVVETKPD